MRRWLIGGSVAAMLLAAGWYLSRPESLEVTLVRVETGPVEKTVANTRAGTIEACARSRLSLAIGGQIDTLAVKEGERVQRGQLLISLWNRDRSARLQEVLAAQVSANRERESLCITAASDAREARRLKQLAEQRLVAEDAIDLARSRAEASSSACEAARAREVQAGAAVDVARAALAQTELRAPFAGVVAEVSGEVGEYSTPSPPGVATPPAIDLLTDDCHYVTAPIDEVDAAAIEAGMPVRITMDAFRDRAFAARVRRIAPYVLDYEKQARTVDVEADFEQLPTSLRLLAGYSADMEIILDVHESTLRVPSELVLEEGYVLVLELGYLRRRDVVKGLSNWRYTEILEGLVAGEQLVGNIGDAGIVPGARAVAAVDRKEGRDD